MPLRPDHGKSILNLLPSELVDEVVGLADHGQRRVKSLGGWSSRSSVLRGATLIPLWVILLRKHRQKRLDNFLEEITICLRKDHNPANNCSTRCRKMTNLEGCCRVEKCAGQEGRA